MKSINKEEAFTLVEVLLAVSVLIIIYIGATTAQISSEVFLKNIRADFEKHLELNNALDHIIKNIRRSRAFGGFPQVQVPNGQTLRLQYIDGNQVVYFQSPDNNIICDLETIARDARVTFSAVDSLVSIQIIEDTSDPGESDKVPIDLISKAYARDK